MATRATQPHSCRPPLLFLSALTLAALLPFLGKPFNIDEPLFLWVARHLQEGNWLDFYGFDINWYGTRSSAAEIIKNPPLASYYLALAASLLGWSERALHLAFLLPALAAVTGSYFLARRLSPHPLAAALLVLFTPVFLVSSATVMCDTLLLACYVWAVCLWLRGLERDSRATLLLAALLVALAGLTKYFGVSLIPLLLAYTLCRPGQRRRACYLLVPVALFCLYQWWTGAAYGRGLLLDAASYASDAKGRPGEDQLSALLQGLSFLGGCFLPAALLALSLGGRKRLALALAALPALALAFSLLPIPKQPVHPWWGYYLQLALFVAAGVLLLWLALQDLRRNRDCDALLLFLWIAGTFLFASCLNWSVNGRSVLPMAPALAILLVRGMKGEGGEAGDWQPLGTPRFLVPLVFGAGLSLLVAWSDYSLAQTARSAAQEISRTFQRGGQPLLFQGHWGFQYYMEQMGGLAWDEQEEYRMPLVMAVPENNTNLVDEVIRRGAPLKLLEFAPLPQLSVMNPALGAGFYSAGSGSLPFALGAVPQERYLVLLFR